MADDSARTYDLAVIGGGPAGLSAGIYGARAGLSTVVVEQSMPGGQIATTDEVDNYPGLPGVSGQELGSKMSEHAEAAGAVLEYGSCTGLDRREDGTFVVTLDGEQPLSARAVVYAAGASPRKAGFAGEDAFRGRGVSYCATCDGMFYRNRDVYVVGGGTAACEEALFLARICRSVTMIVRKQALRTTPAMRRRVEQAEGVTVLYGTRLAAVSGETFIQDVTLTDASTGAQTTRHHEEPAGVFVFVGHDPAVELMRDLADVSPEGIVANEHMATRTSGLFVAGDVRAGVLRQVATAVSDGAIAATSALHYLEGLDAS